MHLSLTLIAISHPSHANLVIIIFLFFILKIFIKLYIKNFYF